MRVSNIPVMIGPNPVRLPERADPTAIPNTGQLYTNDVSGYTELMYQNDVGGELQITTSTAAGCFLNGAAVSLGAAAAGRVVYTAADGTLTSEAAFAYAAATDTLTVGRIGALNDGTATTPAIYWGTPNGTGSACGIFRSASTDAIDGYIEFRSGGTTYLGIGLRTGNWEGISIRRGIPLYWHSSASNDPGSAPAATSLVVPAAGGALALTQTAQATGALGLASWTSAAHTNQTASTEIPGINFNLSATRQWATGALATQREFLIQAPTYGFVGASTISDAATFAISGAPIAGAFCTITRPWALWVQAGASGFPNGTGALPSLAWTSEPTSGFFYSAAQVWGATTIGIQAMGFGNARVMLPAANPLQWTSGTIADAADLMLYRDAAGILAQRNGVNAQLFRVYNTYTSGTNHERLDVGANAGAIGANTFGVVTVKGSAGGTARALYLGTADLAGCSIVTNGTARAEWSSYGLLTLGHYSNAASGTVYGVQSTATLLDSGSDSTTSARAFALTPTINYTGAARTGSVSCLYINPTNTSLPTGKNAALELSGTADALGGILIRRSTAEAQWAQFYWSGVMFTIDVGQTSSNYRYGQLTGGGAAAFSWGYSGSAEEIGFLGTTPYIKYATVGTVLGYTGGGGTALTHSDTFTGDTGATAYTISDVVRALKLYGLLTA